MKRIFALLLALSKAWVPIKTLSHRPTFCSLSLRPHFLMKRKLPSVLSCIMTLHYIRTISASHDPLKSDILHLNRDEISSRLPFFNPLSCRTAFFSREGLVARAPFPPFTPSERRGVAVLYFKHARRPSFAATFPSPICPAESFKNCLSRRSELLLSSRSVVARRFSRFIVVLLGVSQT